MNIGVKFQGKIMKMLRFADDIALLVNPEIELVDSLNVTETFLNNYYMKINIGKTKVFACRTISGKSV